MSKRAAAALVLSGLLAGCLDGPAAMVSTAALAPSPPGWFAFCTAHDGGAACDPIPPASAMPDGAPAAPPPGWRDYCRRHAEGQGCRMS